MKTSWIYTQKYNSKRLINLEENFFISYLEKAWDTGNSETALVFGDPFYPVYCILNGDWRYEYEKVIHLGLEACKNVFIENIEFRSENSNDII